MSETETKVRSAGSLTVRRRAPALARTTRVTVLFADLRGYTGLAERLAPARLVPLLDEFFSVLSNSTALHGGTVFHMAGDGMMAGFGDRDGEHDGARAALAAGHSMLQQVGDLSQRWRNKLKIETGIAIGLHLGEVAIGMLGPPGLRSTTMVGDTVNVAARLCSRARAGEVLLSCTVATALALDGGTRLYVGPIPVLQLPQFALRGRSAPLDIWCVPALVRAAF